MQKNSYFYRVFASSAAALIAVSLVSTAALAAEPATSENSPVPVKQEETVPSASQPAASDKVGASDSAADTGSKTVAPEAAGDEKKAEESPAADAAKATDEIAAKPADPAPAQDEQAVPASENNGETAKKN